MELEARSGDDVEFFCQVNSEALAKISFPACVIPVLLWGLLLN